MALACLLPAFTVQAQVAQTDAGSPAEDGGGQDDIVVTARSYLSVDTSGATNLPIAIEKVPQSISLVSEDFIKSANLRSLADVADYTAGANNSGNQLGLASIITLRGFTAGRAVDGLTVNSFSYFEPDNAIIDRLEIVKGPSSVVYGVSTPGGLVNYVTKSATPTTPNYVYGRYGSWNSFRAEGQVAGALDDQQRFRLIGVGAYDQGDNFIHKMDHRTGTVYAGLDADLSDGLTASVHGGYTRQVRTAFDGIPTYADGSAPDLPRSFFIGSPDMDQRSSVYHAEGDISWQVTDMLKVGLKGNYQKTVTKSETPYAFGLQDDGTFSLGLQDFHNRIRSTSIGLNVNYGLDELGLTDSFVAVSAIRQNIRDNNDILFFAGDATSNLSLGEDQIAADFEALRSDLDSSYLASRLKVTTVSAQTLLKPVSPLSVLLGLSYSKPEAVITRDQSDKFDFKGNVSLRGGLTYEPVAGLNTYVSFSQSFEPQTRRTIDDSPLAPLEGDQYEVGAKYRSPGGRLLLTGALFRITQKNKAVYDQTTGEGDFFKALGKVRHEGLELEAVGSVSRELEVKASYAYLKTKIIDDADPTLVGASELFIPKHSASLFATYTVDDGMAKGVSGGAGFRYVGAADTSFDGSTKAIGSYFLVDASIGYTLDNWIFQLNGRNLFNKRYYVNNYQTLFYGNVVGEPANVSLSAQLKF